MAQTLHLAETLKAAPILLSLFLYLGMDTESPGLGAHDKAASDPQGTQPTYTVSDF